MTQTSNTSKPSTGLDTATGNKTASRWFRLARTPQLPEIDNIMDLYWGGPERRISRLTVRIIGINAAALLMLLIGIVYLGQYQNVLIQDRLKTFNIEVELMSAALAENLTRGNPADMIARMSTASGHVITVFDPQGQKIYGNLITPPVYESDESLYAVRILKDMMRLILNFFPMRKPLPLYPHTETTDSQAIPPDITEALKGIGSLSAWQDKKGQIILSATDPLIQNNQIVGAVHLARSGAEISHDLGEIWMNIILAFFITLVLTTLLSIYLSNVITNPLRRLAQGAEKLRLGLSKDTDIPDLSDRKDEIGELSIAMRAMTQALWERMDSIESFAADVAHELKNPLTSMRSALETFGIVKKEDDRQKLLGIMQHDIERMDRLISDIASLSRLDSELSREALEAVDVQAILMDLIGIYKNPDVQKGLNQQNQNISLNLVTAGEKNFHAQGLPMRIFQVFDNLIANAISFSPPHGTITITLTGGRKNMVVTISDQGPGIPENKLETIFERFYSERPKHEDYGRHSGLGLSICRQIVDALGGTIASDNIRSTDNMIKGACFTVTLKTAADMK